MNVDEIIEKYNKEEKDKPISTVIRVTPTFAIKKAALRNGIYVHLIIDGKPQESFYLDITLKEIIASLKKTDWFDKI